LAVWFWRIERPGRIIVSRPIPQALEALLLGDVVARARLIDQHVVVAG